MKKKPKLTISLSSFQSFFNFKHEAKEAPAVTSIPELGVSSIKRSLSNQISRLVYRSESFNKEIHTLADAAIRLPLQVFYEAYWLNESLDDTIFTSSTIAQAYTPDVSDLLLPTIRSLVKQAILQKISNNTDKALCPMKLFVIKTIVEGPAYKLSTTVDLIEAYEVETYLEKNVHHDDKESKLVVSLPSTARESESKNESVIYQKADNQSGADEVEDLTITQLYQKASRIWGISRPLHSAAKSPSTAVLEKQGFLQGTDSNAWTIG